MSNSIQFRIKTTGPFPDNVTVNRNPVSTAACISLTGDDQRGAEVVWAGVWHEAAGRQSAHVPSGWRISLLVAVGREWQAIGDDRPVARANASPVKTPDHG